MNAVGFAWFYFNFLLALGLTRVIQITTRNTVPIVSNSLGALV